MPLPLTFRTAGARVPVPLKLAVAVEMLSGPPLKLEPPMKLSAPPIKLSVPLTRNAPALFKVVLKVTSPLTSIVEPLSKVNELPLNDASPRKVSDPETVTGALRLTVAPAGMAITAGPVGTCAGLQLEGLCQSAGPEATHVQTCPKRAGIALVTQPYELHTATV